MAPSHFLLLLSLLVLGGDATMFTISNRCKFTIWPGILTGAGKAQLMGGGFELKSGHSLNINAPKGWSGRFWARTGCTFGSSGHGSCVTGDCGGLLRCGGTGGEPPASLAEFTLNSPIDYYDISLVDGFNLPVSILPSNMSRCKATKCVSDLNKNCPAILQVKWHGQIVACKSGCLAFNQPQYCCTGAYSSPHTCNPSTYSKIFNHACPTAYSYAYDDPSTTFTCKQVNYWIVFC